MTTPHFDIIRVFPRQTSYTPDDDMAFIGMPTLFIPEHKEVHISCTFTWDRKYCEQLAYQWEGVTNKPVKLGGVAYGSDCSDFVQGMYVKSNIIFTSRGCNNNCPWCVVPKNEGKLKQLEIVPGNWIQDNNFLQCDRHHKDKVFEMLKTQRGICFKGGLEADLIDDHFCRSLEALGVSKVKELWLACDTDARLPEFKKACEKLKKIGFNRNKIHCYVLSYGKDAIKTKCGQEPYMKPVPCRLYSCTVIFRTQKPSIQLTGTSGRECGNVRRLYGRIWNMGRITKISEYKEDKHHAE